MGVNIESGIIFIAIFAVVWVAIIVVAFVTYRRGTTVKVCSFNQTNWEMNKKLGKPERCYEPWTNHIDKP